MGDKSPKVDLGEFRLTVGAQVFIAEALDDLIVAIKAGNHQHKNELKEKADQKAQAERAAQAANSPKPKK